MLDGVDDQSELAAADLRPGVRAVGQQSGRARRRRHGLAGGDRAQPLRQDRLHHQPDPQSAQLGAQPQPDAAAQRGRRAPPDRGRPGRRQGTPAAALSLSRQHRQDGGRGLAGAHRRYQRDRHRGPLRAGQHHWQALERAHGQPCQFDHPRRRLSRRMAARSAAADAKLCRVVARDAARVPPGRARVPRRRLPELHRPASPR